TAETAPRLAEKYRETVKPGFYREILCGKSNLESCQINSLQGIFKITEQPDILKMDIGFPSFSSDLSLKGVEQENGKTATTLDGWLEIIDAYVAEFAPRAVALKNQSAYSRHLDYDAVPKERAEPLFACHAKGESLPPDDSKALRDFLFRYCVGKGTE